MEPATPVPPPPSRRLGWLWLAVLGLVVGICAVVVQHRATLSSGPPGWTLSHPDIPVRLAALAASDMTPPAGWSLDSHGVLTAPVADASAVDVEAWIPQDGVLELVLEGGGGGASLVLRRGSPDEVGVFRSVRGNATARTPLRCQGALVMPAVGEVVSASLALAQGGLVATVGESQARCRVQKPLRGASARIGVGLRAVSLVAVGARGPGGAAMLRAPSLPVGMRVLAAVLGAGLLLGLGRTLGVARTAGLTLPLVLVLVLIQIDLAVALQAMRIVTDTPDLWALGVPLVGVGFFGMGGLSRALGRQERVLPVWVAPLCGGGTVSPPSHATTAPTPPIGAADATCCPTQEPDPHDVMASSGVRGSSLSQEDLAMKNNIFRLKGLEPVLARPDTPLDAPPGDPLAHGIDHRLNMLSLF